MDLLKAKERVQKRYGEESVMSLQDVGKVPPICSTGLLGLDDAIGIGGYPVERIIEVYGPEGSGKTTLALHAAKEVQALGGAVGFIDVEHALDPDYAQKGIGVSMDQNDFLLSQPDYGEQAIDIAVALLQEQKLDPSNPLLLIVDSVDALVPKKELDADFDLEYDEKGKKVKKPGGAGLGLRARLMSDTCRRITANLKGSNTTVIFINQIRMKIGVMFGNPETTSGGNALKFYASVRMDIRNTGKVDGMDANDFRIKIVKNKVSPPFKTYKGRNIWGKGYLKEYDLFEFLKERSIIQNKGAWFYIEGHEDMKFQGYPNFKNFLDDKEVKKVLQKLTGRKIQL